MSAGRLVVLIVRRMDDTAAGFDRLWAELEPVGRSADTGGYRRFAWTDADLTLREWFAAAAAARGLDVTVDRAGNQWAWWGDPDATPGVVIGSHLDSVPDGGAYDGPLGVVSALAVIDRLRAGNLTPSRPVGVVNFTDEEGARFGVACGGSRLLVGSLDPDRARGLRDADGVTLAEAVTRAGRVPRELGADPRALRRIAAFIELHVEQGVGLAEFGSPVALATEVIPHGRWRLRIDGQANHAGTTRLADRDDPMLVLAEVIRSARAEAVSRGCLATVGKVRVWPNAVNAIPSAVSAWLDARGADAGQVRGLVNAVARGQGIDAVEESFSPASVFDPALRDRLAAALGRQAAAPVPLLATGAGHDAAILSAAGVPSAMIFVRNPTGISHSPAEHAERDDCLAGIAALETAVKTLLEAP
ncbi:MAG: beta-ureidopropionase / N-carbamoyl-L-amino-acid hydrolase [Trebonia sp.]|nr:beta-ureidopropionase / N-carbamoyl-L-amino-acid hydrolase [Trebonia sp.]